eukprot:765518-Hanusia_phi.AAC.20
MPPRQQVRQARVTTRDDGWTRRAAPAARRLRYYLTGDRMKETTQVSNERNHSSRRWRQLQLRACETGPGKDRLQV